MLAAVCGISLARNALGGTGGTTNSLAAAVPDPVLSLLWKRA